MPCRYRTRPSDAWAVRRRAIPYLRVTPLHFAHAIHWRAVPLRHLPRPGQREAVRSRCPALRHLATAARNKARPQQSRTRPQQPWALLYRGSARRDTPLPWRHPAVPDRCPGRPFDAVPTPRSAVPYPGCGQRHLAPASPRLAIAALFRTQPGRRVSSHLHAITDLCGASPPPWPALPGPQLDSARQCRRCSIQSLADALPRFTIPLRRRALLCLRGTLPSFAFASQCDTLPPRCRTRRRHAVAELMIAAADPSSSHALRDRAVPGPDIAPQHQWVAEGCCTLARPCLATRCPRHTLMNRAKAKPYRTKPALFYAVPHPGQAVPYTAKALQ